MRLQSVLALDLGAGVPTDAGGIGGCVAIPGSADLRYAGLRHTDSRCT